MDINKALADLKFIGSTVQKIKLDNNFIYIENDESLKRKIEVEYGISDPEETLDKNDRYLGVVTLDVKITVSNKIKKLTLSVIISGLFEASKEIGTLNDFTNLLGLNGCATLYSIARSLIMSITAQSTSGLNITLPMINVFKLKEEKVKHAKNKIQ